MSRTRASFSHLQLLVFEGRLARKLRFHIFSFQVLRDVSYESFAFTSSAFTFWGPLRVVSRDSFVFASSTYTFCEVLHECGLKIAGARNAVFCRTKRVSEDGWGRFAARRLRGSLGCTGIMVGSAPQWNCRFRRRFAQLEPKKMMEVLEGFTSSTFRFWGKEKLRFHIFNFLFFWGKSRTKALFSHLQLAVFEGSLARKMRWEIRCIDMRWRSTGWACKVPR